MTLSTDDRTVSDLTLIREYANALDPIGLTLPELWAIDRHALEVAFLHHDEPLRASLLARLRRVRRRTSPLLSARPDAGLIRAERSGLGSAIGRR